MGHNNVQGGDLSHPKEYRYPCVLADNIVNKGKNTLVMKTTLLGEREQKLIDFALRKRGIVVVFFCCEWR